mgnify:CR=1 FL=1
MNTDTQCDIKINRLLQGNDPVRDTLFSKATKFYCDAIVDDEFENKDSKLFFDSFFEYINIDRPEQINELIEFELEDDHTSLESVIKRIQDQDRRFLYELINYRSEFEKYV